MSGVEEYPAGATVEVTFRGTVLDGGHLQVTLDDPCCLGKTVRLHPRALRHAISTTRLPDPEPTWQVGDVVSWVEDRVTHVATYIRRVQRVAISGLVWLDGPMVYGFRDANRADGELMPREEVSSLWRDNKLTLIARNGARAPWPTARD